MSIEEIYSLILDKMNQLGTNFSQEVTAFKAMAALDQAQNYWYDERLRLQELTRTIQRELQHLIITEPVSGDSTGDVIAVTLPKEYYHFSLVMLKPTACTSTFDSVLIEHANVGSFLRTDTTRPSLMWEQSFCTVGSNRLMIYVDFPVEGIELSYYRKLIKPDIATDYKHLDGRATQNITLDFEGSSLYEIIEIACLILSGNFNDNFKVTFRDKLVKEFR